MCDQLDETVEISEDMELTNESGTDAERLEADKDDLLKYYKDFLMNGCLQRFSAYMNLDLEGRPIDNLPLYDLPSLSYGGRGENDHSRQETDDYYFCKYGIAYAFEYAMLYDIMLRIHDIPQFGVYSFGSGGYIDAWSLAYARAKLQEQGTHLGLKLYYQGVDVVQWPTTVFSEAVEEMNDRQLVREFKIPVDDTERTVSHFTFRRPQLSGIQEFSPVGGRNQNEMNYNVLMFSKLLNVINPDALEAFITRLSEFIYGQSDREGRSRDYYICVSHSPADLEGDAVGVAAVQKIVQMFREKHFVPIGNLQDILGEEQYNNLRDSFGIEIVDVPGGAELDDSIKKYYKIDGRNMTNGRIWNLNSDFQFDEPDNRGFTNDAQRFLQSLFDRSGERYQCRQTSWANIAFQIIKLTKSQEE